MSMPATAGVIRNIPVVRPCDPMDTTALRTTSSQGRNQRQQPLTAILCNAQAAQMLTANELLNVEELREILMAIINDDKHAGQIIQRQRALLTRGETQFQAMEIDRVIEDALAIAHGKLIECNVQVKTRIDAGIPAVHGDRVEIQQVLLSLILNACESMGANPACDRRIEIVIVQEENAVCISVLDCGTGIRGDRLENITRSLRQRKVGWVSDSRSATRSSRRMEGDCGLLYSTPRRRISLHVTSCCKGEE
jgi:two-component system sensor kinase FixL